MLKGYKKNTQFLTFFVSGIVFFMLLSMSMTFMPLNKNIQIQYYHLKNFFSPPQISQNILVVWIDEKSFEVIGQFPFERSIYAQAINNINSLWVATIALDLLLLDRSTELEDIMLTDTLSSAQNVILWAAIDREGKVYVPSVDIFWWKSDYWFLSPLVESSNRTVYSFRPQFISPEYGVLEHFTLRVLRKYYEYMFERDYSEAWKYSQQSYHFTPLWDIPLSRSDRKEVLIRFTNPEDYPYISFSDLLDKEFLSQDHISDKLQDAIVIIWPAAEWLKDEFFTPNGVEYGVYIHANILNTLMTRQYLLYFNSFYEWVLIFCIILLSVSVNFSSKTRVLLYGNSVIFILFTLLVPLGILFFSNLVINFPFEIGISFFLSFWVTNLIKYLIEDTNKARLGKALSEYVSTDVMEEVLHERWKVFLDGEKRKLIIYFSDIEHFTDMSEKLHPEELVAFLREYLGVLTEILMKHGAYIDKYEGDSIMALWGAFSPLTPEDAWRVSEVLLEQEIACIALGKKWEQQLWRVLKVRTWVHTWDAIVWNIWAPGRKMNFTALWDTINLASRLEWVNKYYGTYTCVSEDFLQDMWDEYIFCEVDSIKVTWKNIPVKIYMLLWKSWEVDQKLLIHKEQYEYALELYKKQDFVRAEELFSELSSEWFSPALTLLRRTQDCPTHTPDKNWDGIWIMEGK